MSRCPVLPRSFVYALSCVEPLGSFGTIGRGGCALVVFTRSMLKFPPPPPPPPPPPLKIQRLFENITCEADRFPIELSEKRMAGEKRSSRGKIRRWREDWSLWCWRQRVVLLVPASSSRYYIARTYRYPSDCFVLNVFSLFCAPKCISPH